jgi:nitroimidazol reductase NimA-like FMN-containing flavoprotein (pyridoxamine 5'-phosphate oxidase superfamily)
MYRGARCNKGMEPTRRSARLMPGVGRHSSSCDDGWEGTVSLAMTKQERETFLADLHVAIISIPEEGRGPLTVPIWYSYEPGGELRVVTAGTSRKAQLLRHAGRFSLCVQTETQPYKYVSVEGPVVAIEPADVERDRRPLAHRYLGVQRGDRYIEETRGECVGNVLVRMLPQRWLTVDYAKA